MERAKSRRCAEETEGKEADGTQITLQALLSVLGQNMHMITFFSMTHLFKIQNYGVHSFNVFSTYHL